MSGHYVPNDNRGWNYVGGYQEPTYLLELQGKEQLMNYINPNWGDRQQEYLEETIVSEDERQKIIEEYEELTKILLEQVPEIGRNNGYVVFKLNDYNGWLLHLEDNSLYSCWGNPSSELIMHSMRWLAIERQLMELEAI